MLCDADLAGIAEVGDRLTCVDTLDDFAAVMMGGLHELVEGEFVHYNDVDVAHGTGRLRSDPDDLESIDLVRWAEVVGQNPMVPLGMAGVRRPLRFCDVARDGEIERTDLWQEFLHPMAGDYMIVMTVDATRDWIVGIGVSRGDREFSERDVEVLSLLRPAAVLAHRLVAARDRAGRITRDALVARGLTTRQAEVLEVVASGATNLQAARMLHVSEATIAKHLERAYRTLGVGTRGAAVAVALDFKLT